jgi:hypothetical protein
MFQFLRDVTNELLSGEDQYMSSKEYALRLAHEAGWEWDGQHWVKGKKRFRFLRDLIEEILE